MSKRVPAIVLALTLSLFAATLYAGYLSNRRSGEDMKKAQELAASGKTDAAISAYQDLIKKYPDSDLLGQAWLELGRLYFQKQSFDQAAKAFEQTLNNPGGKDNLFEAKLWRGKSYFQLKKYPLVIESLSGLFEQARDSAVKTEIAGLMFRSCIELKDYKAGLLWLGKYAELGGKDLDKAKASVPEWLAALKDSELQEVFDSAGPEWTRAEAGFALGQRYYQAGSLKEAKNIFSTLLSRFPNTAHQAELEQLLEQAEELIQVVPFRLGLILPLSGAYQTFGDRALKGALLAAGIFSYPKSPHKFELRIENSLGDPELAKEAAAKLVLEDHVLAIVGPILNPVASAVSEVSEQLRVPMIALSPAPGLTDKKSYVFRNCMTKQSQVKMLLDWAVAEKKFSKFAVIYPDDKYGAEFASIFSAEVKARGAELVKSVSYPPEETDFREAIGELEPRALLPEPASKSKKSQDLPLNFDALFIPDAYEKVGIIVPQLLFYRVKPQFLGTSSWHSDKIFEHTRENYLEGAAFADLFAPELETKEMDDYRYRYEQAYQEDPGLIDLQAYETVALIIDLVEKQRIGNRKELVDALKNLKSWTGPLGPVTVSPALEFEHQVHLFQIKKGKFEVVK